MIFSTHSIVSSLSSQLSFGQLDVCLQDILQLCMQDQFEDTAEEKDIGKIHGEVNSLKPRNNYRKYFSGSWSQGKKDAANVLDSGKICVSKIHRKSHSNFEVLVCLLRVHFFTVIFRDIVDQKTNSKTIQKVSDLLEKFAHGLKANEGENFEFKILDHKQTQVWFRPDLTTFRIL